MKSSRCVSLVVFLLSSVLMAHSQTDVIRAKLGEKFPQGMGAGTQITMRRDGLWMFGEDNLRPLSNIYKNGVISQAFIDALRIKTTIPPNRETPPAGLPHLRKFYEGEKLWVTSVSVRSDSVELTLRSDPINFVSYIATLKFVFSDKKLPTPDVLMNSLGEVVQLLPATTTNEAAASTQFRPGSEGPQGIAVAPPIKKLPVVGALNDRGEKRKTTSGTVDPATADLVGLHLGMTASETNAALEKRAGRSLERVRGLGMLCKTKFCLVVDDDQLTPGKMHAQRTILNTNQFEIVVEYTEIYPEDSARPEIATTIRYSPQLQSDADREAFRSRVTGKYGPGTTNDGWWTNWCMYLDTLEHCKAPLISLYENNGTVSVSIEGDREGLWEREKAAWNSKQHTEQPPL